MFITGRLLKATRDDRKGIEAWVFVTKAGRVISVARTLGTGKDARVTLDIPEDQCPFPTTGEVEVSE